MGTERGDGALGGHARVADGVRAGHLRKIEALGDVGRIADLLIDLDHVAGAHDADAGEFLANSLAGLFSLVGRAGQDGVGRLHVELQIRANRLPDGLGEIGEVSLRTGRLKRYLDLAGIGSAVDGETCRIRPALAHRGKHSRRQLT
jgi:hypothetical protein